VTRISTEQLVEMKSAGEKIVSLTAYDASFATVLDEAGVEVILVGDSLGMVLHGEDSTLNVTMEDMIYHTRHAV
jgi:3-methyl-2-oxobutanoate hydroxymethyltransferase